MFSAYFIGSYFPTGWGGASEPAAPGAISAALHGAGSASMHLAGAAHLASGVSGSGSLTGALETTEGGTGMMAAAISGASSFLASLAVTDANPPAISGGVTGLKRIRDYAEAAMACRGRGSVRGSLVAAGPALAGAVIHGAGRLEASAAVTERLVVRGFVPSPPPVIRNLPPTPAAVFVPTTYATMGMTTAGRGTLTATLEATTRIPEADDSEAMALLLLLLEAA